MEKTVWSSDVDLNGLETVARITKVDGNYYLEVVSAEPKSFLSRLRTAWRVLTGKMSIFSFVIFTDRDKWVRRIEDGEENSKG